MEESEFRFYTARLQTPLLFKIRFVLSMSSVTNK